MLVDFTNPRVRGLGLSELSLLAPDSGIVAKCGEIRIRVVVAPAEGLDQGVPLVKFSLPLRLAFRMEAERLGGDRSGLKRVDPVASHILQRQDPLRGGEVRHGGCKQFAGSEYRGD
jgi:hypothetical protein